MVAAAYSAAHPRLPATGALRPGAGDRDAVPAGFRDGRCRGGEDGARPPGRGLCAQQVAAVPSPASCPSAVYVRLLPAAKRRKGLVLVRVTHVYLHGRRRPY